MKSFTAFYLEMGFVGDMILIESAPVVCLAILLSPFSNEFHKSEIVSITLAGIKAEN